MGNPAEFEPYRDHPFPPLQAIPQREVLAKPEFNPLVAPLLNRGSLEQDFTGAGGYG